MDLTEHYKDRLIKIDEDLSGKDPVKDSGSDQNGSFPAGMDLFWDFDKFPVFIGVFNGHGETVPFENVKIDSWSFTDLTGRKWLIPKWKALNISTNSFLGFASEEPGPDIFHIHYKEFKRLENGGTQHIIEVFKKRPI
jgi:hypothetical protein